MKATIQGNMWRIVEVYLYRPEIYRMSNTKEIPVQLKFNRVL